MTHYAIFTLPLVATIATMGGTYLYPRAAPKAPPTSAIAHYSPEWDHAFQDFPRPIRVVRITRPQPQPEVEVAEVPIPRPRPEPEPQIKDPDPEFRSSTGARTLHRTTRPRYIYRGSDLCSRHNRRKVFVSRYKWRCLK